jgi:hypothetical protein
MTPPRKPRGCGLGALAARAPCGRVLMSRAVVHSLAPFSPTSLIDRPASGGTERGGALVRRGDVSTTASKASEERGPIERVALYRHLLTGTQYPFARSEGRRWRPSRISEISDFRRQRTAGHERAGAFEVVVKSGKSASTPSSRTHSSIGSKRRFVPAHSSWPRSSRVSRYSSRPFPEGSEKYSALLIPWSTGETSTPRSCSCS